MHKIQHIVSFSKLEKQQVIENKCHIFIHVDNDINFKLTFFQTKITNDL
jgi:hypothetical protein